MKQILVIEDDREIQELLQYFLEAEGYRVVLASDGYTGMEYFSRTPFDLVLLDILLPGRDGYTVCRMIRERSQVPIMILTALSSEADQIKGLDLKADDYITKPFSAQVLIRKIAAVLRRSPGKAGCSELIYKDLRLEINNYRAWIKDRLVDLTKREYEILQELLQNQGKTITRDSFLDRVWAYEYYGDPRVVDTHIKNLRRKLEVDYIETVRGVGYRIRKEE